ncbi:hypothetical protein FNV43_RR18074 [Rhamnella rubrinervis]|uniref:Uncharacterized protein n=1 Tax=Rhamnella rubrinervis TaxID=2594499 RepID=A0A8K0GVW5_9ROSA|nr:hypothetical protein FNV43_RR18074 [Rhamnella rubrinervis]
MNKYQEKKAEINKEKEAEDWCFVCKDGGQLIICDYRDCPKVYHTNCIRRDKSFMEDEELWTCGWHCCIICQKTSKFHCICCPNAVCEECINVVELALIREDNGLCKECLELVILGQDDVAYDPDGGIIDFRDIDTEEGLFKEYWEFIQKKESWTMDDIYDAKSRLKKNENHHRLVSEKSGKIKKEDEAILSESDKEDLQECQTLGKRKKSSKQKFIGWGSKPLIEFLESIGIDTTKQLSRSKVDSIITEYIEEKKLVHPENKEMILCDTKLYSILGKSSLRKKKMYNLLEAHFLENSEQLEEHKQSSSDQDNGGNDNISQQSYASIVAHNMKLVYLKRSLVEELLKQPESFEGKVVGSFVNVKMDPKDNYLGGSHQLLPVRGVKRISTGEVLIKVSSEPDYVHLSKISDFDFTEDECRTLQEKIKNGLLKKPTLLEIEEKATSLHEDITKHVCIF